MFVVALIATVFISIAQAKNHYVENLQPKIFLPSTLSRILIPKVDRESKVINGHEAEPNSIPYQVGIYLDRPNGSRGFCGGALISRNYVLTAAHCTNGTLSAEVVLGAHRIWEDELTQIRIKSYDLHAHELYGSVTSLYDIALISLPEPVNLNENINVVILPTRQQQTCSFASEPALLSGWGKTSDASTSISDYLQYANTYIMENRSCGMYFLISIRDSHICSDGYNSQVSACNGDSGGPLVVDNTLVGLVSFGSLLGCNSMWPTVYTRVTSYLDWIEEHSDVIIKE